jgi:hypothetical protein
LLNGRQVDDFHVVFLTAAEEDRILFMVIRHEAVKVSLPSVAESYLPLRAIFGYVHRKINFRYLHRVRKAFQHDKGSLQMSEIDEMSNDKYRKTDCDIILGFGHSINKLHRTHNSCNAFDESIVFNRISS